MKENGKRKASLPSKADLKVVELGDSKRLKFGL